MKKKDKKVQKTHTNTNFTRTKKCDGSYVNEAYRPLTKRQIRLVKEFLMDPERGKFSAYKRAGYKGSGPAGRQSASNIFNKANVKRAVNEGLQKMRAHAQDEVNVTFEWVMRHLKTIIDFDIREMFDEEGRIKDVWQLSDTAAMALSSIDMGTTMQKVRSKGKSTQPQILTAYVKKVKHYDKLRALELVVELMGFKKKNENEDLTAEEVAQKVREGMMGIWDSVPLSKPDVIDDDEKNKELAEQED